jgi:hypothetical protein
MSDRRTVWLSIASTAAAIGGGAFIAGIIAPAPIVWLPGLILLLVSALGFISLLRGWPVRSLSKSDLTLQPAISEPGEALPTFVIPSHGSEEQEMHQLGPYNWLPGLGPKEPEVTMRAVVALPAVSARDYSGDLATAVRGEAREGRLIDLLNSAEFTAWLRTPREPSPWQGEPTWQVRGSGFSELTELVYAPPLEPNQVLPFLVRCAVLTGWRPTPDGFQSKALRFMVEMQFNSSTASQTQDGSLKAEMETAPLSLDDIAGNFTRLLDALDLSTAVADHLLPEVHLSAGYFGLWFTIRGLMLEQVVDLSGIARVAGAVGRGDALATGSWECPGGPVGEARGNVVANMFDDLLESAGYRGVTDRFDWLR